MSAPTKGNARLSYDPGGGTVNVDLDWPLYRITPGSARRRYVTDSVDLTTREVLVVGNGVRELYAVVRFISNPIEVLACLEAGADGRTITYDPDTTAGGATYPFLLIEPGGDALRLLRDQSEWGAVLHEVAIRVRRVDGGTFDGLFP